MHQIVNSRQCLKNGVIIVSIRAMEFGSIESSDARPYLTQNLSRLVENIYRYGSVCKHRIY